MAYSITEQYVRDIDFFLTFPDAICHFASAGSRLPRFIEENDILNEENSTVISRVSSEIVGQDGVPYMLNEGLSQIIGIEAGTDEFNMYTRDFINFAKLGFFSFDKTRINDREDGIYHLVAYPKNENDAESLFNKWRSHISPLMEVRERPFPYFWRHYFYRYNFRVGVPFNIFDSPFYFMRN